MELEEGFEPINQQVEYENGNEATIKWSIWHMADHNRYHQAHISQLRNGLAKVEMFVTLFN
ncbi:hypothetical protein SAMN05878482_106215 [Peribacillus simplex]|uniref:DinB family protein n=1 Tax=Peribacillus simplex TaxID=1478 RepID=A0A9X8RC58_9BACI|nr:hypothetical protein [Peribacillus simplex]SIR85840.1 hypothetical protein SAMN05878482_106215 [Peribacillus simplex]